MVAWSGLLRSTGQILLRGRQILPNILRKNGSIQTRLMSEHRLMPMEPTRWQWHKTKDLLHLYFMVGFIPCSIIVFLSHVFVGPAELTAIPEGYVPKHWEYHRDPITRFIARYFHTSAQQEYEKYMHFAWTESEIIKIRKLEAKVKDLMYERKDYQAYYYQPYIAKYARHAQVLDDQVYEGRKVIE